MFESSAYDSVGSMHRRAHIKLFAALLGTTTLALAGCQKKPEMPAIDLPPFSPQRLHASLESLRVAYEAKGQSVSKSLLPPLSEEALRSQCAWFPAPLPPEIVALYAWRNGQAKGAWEEENPFWFRDCGFLNIHLAQLEYKSMMASYGKPEFAVPQIDLATCFPFAGFNGGWYVFPCAGQRFDKRLAFPIVSVFQGVDIFYYSLESMVETCVDWVSHAGDQPGLKDTEGKGLEIWRKHNPGIFPSLGA
jgi:hypothetical protein